MTCYSCSKRLVYFCDLHGAIPADRVTKDHECPDWSAHEDAMAVLNRWYGEAPHHIRERIKAIVDVMELKEWRPELDEAVTWVCSLPDSQDARALKMAVRIPDDWSPL